MNTEPSSPADTTIEAGNVETAGEEPINILLVDDEPKNLTVLETILDDPAYRLVRAETADQALLALVVEEFALLILDIRMPGMSGLELAQMIKERKKTALVPIIFLTAYYNEDQHVLAGYGTGAVDYLHKPVNPAILRSKVTVFADLHRKSQQVSAANRQLLNEVTERRRAEERLRELNDTLEQRVRERTEALEEADRRKDEFLATLAHELRNPLAPVRNAVQMLRHKNTAATQVDFARDVIERQVRSMSRLIDDLMDLSRINHGKINLKKTQVELADVLREAVDSSRPLLDQGRHEFAVEFPPEPVPLDADPTRLGQVFLNLLNNAAKFTPPGGRISLRAERIEAEAVVTIRDTGIGISTEHLQSVFRMFSQVEGALSRSHGGLGIGLSLVKRFVEMHGGTVEARSEGRNQGSEFVVRLPVLMEPLIQTPGVAEAIGFASSAPSKLHILVVDDNRDAADSLRILIEMVGHRVSVAHAGDEAVELAGKVRPDIVLLDIGLPKLNGYEVARAIRRETWGRSMFLVAVTGWGQEDDRRKAHEAGFDQHRVKPVDPDSIMKLFHDFQSNRS